MSADNSKSILKTNATLPTNEHSSSVCSKRTLNQDLSSATDNLATARTQMLSSGPYSKAIAL